MKPIIEMFVTQSKVDALARWIIGGIFVYASIHKMIDPAGFAKIIYGYGILPHSLINLVAIILPFVECLSGICVILGVWPRSSAVLINLMLAVFMLAISFNLIRGHEFDCGCFSVDGHRTSGLELLVRDALCFAVGMIPIMFRGKRFVLIPFKKTCCS